ncbi:MAG TPA: YqeG family HAD IIIA-type phosphatase [Candidatus Fimenecus excrementigallinarum]|uniref:YqeG family HAD IIIA-type phosphatase n=1 Tax=Candidatus Fimenecus excrementigallinarum TaxID=2840816 RepID=A0A9D1IE93_9FIRM|nr:YqeG family HAD IIIA-type phosphatase [Candidatus Fimenecus excrementigallinarum]
MDKTALLMPKYRFKSVLDVRPEDLRKMGARAVGLDIDNTLAPDGTMKFLAGAEQWVREIQAAGFPVILISNGTILRVAPIAKRFSLPYVSLSMKPRPRGLLRAAKRLGVPVTQLAMLGDQLFSDVLAANRCGAIAVRIDPIPMKSLYPLYYKWKEKREQPILEAFEKLHGYGVYED